MMAAVDVIELQKKVGERNVKKVNVDQRLSVDLRFGGENLDFLPKTFESQSTKRSHRVGYHYSASFVLTMQSNPFYGVFIKQ